MGLWILAVLTKSSFVNNKYQDLILCSEILPAETNLETQNFQTFEAFSSNATSRISISFVF